MIADDMEAAISNEFRTLNDQRVSHAKNIAARDATIYKEIIALFDKITKQIAETCREEVRFTYSSVTLEKSSTVSRCRFELEQGPVNYAVFGPIIFDVVLDSVGITINNHGFEHYRLSEAFRFMLDTVLKAMDTERYRADFGIGSDPIYIMARRNR